MKKNVYIIQKYNYEKLKYENHEKCSPQYEP